MTGELAQVRGSRGGERGGPGVQLRLQGHSLQPHQVCDVFIKLIHAEADGEAASAY